MKGQIPLHCAEVSAADRARLDREEAILTGRTEHPRSYRFVNGLGTEYRVEAHSAIQAAGEFKRLHRISPGLEKLQVVENGGWVYVI